MTYVAVLFVILLGYGSWQLTQALAWTIRPEEATRLDLLRQLLRKG